jgi:hypothetical protein
MPVCGQCGKDNPEGLIYCGHCAAPMDASAPASRRAVAPSDSSKSPASGAKPSMPRQFRPPVVDLSAPEKKGGIEWIPWNELSFGQKAGRMLLTVVIIVLSFAVIRIALDFALHRKEPAQRRAASADAGPLTASDRKDGVQSLCKVFQIYGMPQTAADADAAAKNAQELFKLAGNESPGRSEFILTTIASEFQTGKLKADDCSAAGEPLPTSAVGGSSGAP